MAIEISRSMNSHMRSPRSVTLAPMALPSRSLKPAMDLLARVTIGFWPVMVARSRTAPSSSEAWAAAPTPMLTTTLSSRDLHDVAEAQLVLELAAERLVVPGLERGSTRSWFCVTHAISPPHFLQTRTFWPDLSIL